METVGEIQEGDILVIEHDGENASIIYEKDDEEKKDELHFCKNDRIGKVVEARLLSLFYKINKTCSKNKTL